MENTNKIGFWKKIGNWFKKIFTSWYSKPLLELDVVIGIVNSMDQNKDNKVSIKEIVDTLKEFAKKVKNS